MINIYAMYFKRNGSVITAKERIQVVPAGDSGIKILNPTVKADWGNAGSLDFSIQSGTPYYDAFMQMRTFIQVEYDGETIFYGRVLTIDNGFFGERKIHCEGPLTFLNDTYYPGVKKENKTKMSAWDRIQQLLNNHNSQVDDELKRIYPGEVPGNYTSATSSEQRLKNDEREFDSTSWSNTKSALEDLKSHYGGSFRIRYSGNRLYLDWMNHYYRSTVNSQSIEIGKNLIDLSTVTEVNNIFTAVIPIGKTEEGNDSVYLTGYQAPNGFTFNNAYLKVPDLVRFYSDSELNSGYHQADDYRTAIDRYGMIYKTVDLQEGINQATLLQKALEWVKDNYQGSIESFTVKAIDLHQIGTNTDKILVGDRVRLVYKVGSENGQTRSVSPILTCTSVVYDLYSPENNQYSFGIPASSLSKNYATETKKSVKNKSTAPSSTYNPPSGGTEEDPSEAWRKEVYRWLKNHKVWKKSTGNVETGPAGRDAALQTLLHYHSSLDENGNSKYELWNPTRVGKVIDTDGQKRITWARDSQGRPSGPNGSWTILTEEQLTIKALELRYIFEYVRDEHGVNLTTGLAKQKPAAYTDEDGNLTLSDEVPDITSPQGMTTMIARGLFDGVMGGFTTYGTDSQGEYKSEQRADGSIVYYRKDASGDWQEVDSIRNLSLSVKQTDDFVGSVVVEGNEGTDEKLHIYNFGQAIERHPEGEVVVAYVDGDKLMIGSDETRWSYQIANRISTNWVKPFFYTTNDQGEKTRVYLDPAGTVSYRGYYDSITGDFVKKETGDQGPHGEPIISVTGTGVWDEKNLKLKGGIQTGLVDGQYVTFVKSDRLVIGNGNTGKSVTDALLEANVITYNQGTNTYSPQGLVTESVYANDLYAINGRFQTIYTDYLTTQWVSARIADMENVGVQNLYGLSNSSHANFTEFYGYHFYLQKSGGGGSVSTYDIGLGMSDLTLTGPVNNVYTLTKFTYGQDPETSTGTVVGTFSRAITSWNDGWSNGILTITAVPQLQSYKVGLGTSNLTLYDMNLNIYSEGNAVATEQSGLDRNKYLDQAVVIKQFNGAGSEETLVYTRETPLLINATPAFNAGWNQARTKVVNTLDTSDIGGSSTNASISIDVPKTNGSASVDSYTWTLEKTTWRPTGATSDVPIVRLKYAGNNNTVARIDCSSIYNDGKSAGVTEGTNSVTASAPDVKSIGNTDVTSIQVRSKTSTGKYSSYKSLAFSLSTYTPTGQSSSHECVIAKDSNTVVGRYDIQSICNTYWSNGHDQGVIDGKATFTRLDSSKFYCTRTYVAGQGYKYTLTLTSSTMLSTLSDGSQYILYK